MANFSLEIGSAISTGWEYAKKYGLLIAVIYLLVGLVTGGVSNLLSPSLSPDVYRQMGEALGQGDFEAFSRYADLYNGGFGASVGTLFSFIICIVVSAGLYNLALGLVSGRYDSVEFEAFLQPLSVYLKALVIAIIVGFFISIAAFLCIIPAFIVGPRLAFSILYQIENPEAGIWESIKASWNMTSGNTLALIGFAIVCAFIYFIGVLCCCVGVYFAEVIGLFAMIAAYYQLKGNLQ
ncbi:MAG: hypothetical protein IJ693_08570 [Bacteroidaceae bacterium]|nr:hypothetical protein [Bacteroidaceae bacterium]